MRLLAKTLEGLEDVLANELRDLGAEEILVVKRAVIYSGDLQLLYRSNLMLRSAIKILVIMKEFEVKDEQELYDQIKKIKWEEYLSNENTFAIDSVVNSEDFRHSNYIALKTKDAIVDRFREKTGERPSIDTKSPDLRINIHIRNNTATLSLDSSGRSLHMRGYRLEMVEAPLNETLAAGLVLLSGWDKTTPLIDPMCGSGTILCEAAFYALGISPHRQSRNFDVQKWLSFNAELWDMVHKEAFEPTNTALPTIKGYDLNQKAVQISQKNIENAGLASYITVEGEDFFFQDSATETMLIFNPPYDARLQEDEILDFYKFIGDKLKSSFSGCSAWILSGHLEAMKNVGLRPSRKIGLLNGSINSLFCKYEMYSGSKKQKFQHREE